MICVERGRGDCRRHCPQGDPPVGPPFWAALAPPSALDTSLRYSAPTPFKNFTDVNGAPTRLVFAPHSRACGRFDARSGGRGVCLSEFGAGVSGVDEGNEAAAAALGAAFEGGDVGCAEAEWGGWKGESWRAGARERA